MKTEIKNNPWWKYLDKDIQELFSESLLLLDKAASWPEHFHDYSFVVFPAAKAYEGFLKKLFLDMGFISKEDYFNKHFRIGKSLNPSLDEFHRNGRWVYKELTQFCRGKDLPDELWETWKRARNQTFHWFPNEINAINLAEAHDRIERIFKAIDNIFKTCSVQLNKISSNVQRES